MPTSYFVVHFKESKLFIEKGIPYNFIKIVKKLKEIGSKDALVLLNECQNVALLNAENSTTSREFYRNVHLAVCCAGEDLFEQMQVYLKLIAVHQKKGRHFEALRYFQRLEQQLHLIKDEDEYDNFLEQLHEQQIDSVDFVLNFIQNDLWKEICNFSKNEEIDNRLVELGVKQKEVNKSFLSNINISNLNIFSTTHDVTPWVVSAMKILIEIRKINALPILARWMDFCSEMFEQSRKCGLVEKNWSKEVKEKYQLLAQYAIQLVTLSTENKPIEIAIFSYSLAHYFFTRYDSTKNKDYLLKALFHYQAVNQNIEESLKEYANETIQKWDSNTLVDESFKQLELLLYKISNDLINGRFPIEKDVKLFKNWIALVDDNAVLENLKKFQGLLKQIKEAFGEGTDLDWFQVALVIFQNDSDKKHKIYIELARFRIEQAQEYFRTLNDPVLKDAQKNVNLSQAWDFCKDSLKGLDREKDQDLIQEYEKIYVAIATERLKRAHKYMKDAKKYINAGQPKKWTGNPKTIMENYQAAWEYCQEKVSDNIFEMETQKTVTDLKQQQILLIEEILPIQAKILEEAWQTFLTKVRSSFSSNEMNGDERNKKIKKYANAFQKQMQDFLNLRGYKGHSDYVRQIVKSMLPVISAYRNEKPVNQILLSIV